MKRLTVAVLLICALCGVADAQQWAKVSDVKTADALIFTGDGYWHGISFTSDAANAITVDVYDNTSAAGTKLIQQFVVTTSATNRFHTLSLDPPVAFHTGLYIDITCAGAVSYVVYYK
jgi:hypothetical protein